MTTIGEMPKTEIRTERQTMARQTVRPCSNARPGILSRIAIVWGAIVNSIIPIGYEDEMGFHYGNKPATNRPDLTLLENLN